MATQAENFVFVSYGEYPFFTPKRGKKYIFQDEWERSKSAVKAKLLYEFGGCKNIFARKCSVKLVAKNEAKSFFHDNHIMSYANSKYHYGLWYLGEAVAMASFANERKFPYGNSAELLRFCNKNELVVTGGLSKLIKHYLRLHQPADMITYVDALRDEGNSFTKIGFAFEAQLGEMPFMVDTKNAVRVPLKHFKPDKMQGNYVALNLPGSLKFRLKN